MLICLTWVRGVVWRGTEAIQVNKLLQAHYNSLRFLLTHAPVKILSQLLHLLRVTRLICPLRVEHVPKRNASSRDEIGASVIWRALCVTLNFSLWIAAVSTSWARSSRSLVSSSKKLLLGNRAGITIIKSPQDYNRQEELEQTGMLLHTCTFLAYTL